MKNEAPMSGHPVADQRNLMLELKLATAEAVGATCSADEMPSRPAFPRRLLNWLRMALQKRRETIALLELNDGQLKDIGLSRCQAYGGYSRYRNSGDTHIDDRDPV